MGLFQSTLDQKAHDVKQQVLEFQAKQRELQMAIGIAQTRDLVQYLSGVWVGIFTLTQLPVIAGKGFPKPAAVPLIVLPLVIGYQADMAYMNKMRRVVQEAEHILEHERHRFVPPKQAPFASLYDEEKQALEATEWGKIPRVGHVWPSAIRGYFEGR